MIWFKVIVTVWLSLNNLHRLRLVLFDGYEHILGLAIQIFVTIGMWFFV